MQNSSEPNSPDAHERQLSNDIYTLACEQVELKSSRYALNEPTRIVLMAIAHVMAYVLTAFRIEMLARLEQAQKGADQAEVPEGHAFSTAWFSRGLPKGKE